MAEAKRRLPVWMLKQTTETKAPGFHANLKSEEKSEDLIKEKHSKRKQRKRGLEEKCEEQVEEGPVKRKQRRKTSNQFSDEFDEAEIEVQRYKTRQRSTRARKKDATKFEEENEESTDNLKRKRGRKRMAVISDDDEDLTVDDLVSIAEEYVNAERDKLKTYADSATTENYPPKDSLKPMPASGLTKGLLKCSMSSKHALSENDNLKEDTSIPSNVGKTGDPAQDMLNLFLGPLLKKPPPVKEPTIEPVEEVTSSSVDFSDKTERRAEKNVVEEREMLVKKKSSLKDKVATFLS